MIHDSLPRWRTLPGLSSHAIWSTAFQWLETKAATAPEGDHPLGQDGFFARVMAYPTKDRPQAKYEMHRKTIDIQYTVEGAEGIEVTDTSRLVALNNYSEAAEVEHFETPSLGNVRVDNLAGWFTILFAGEPHMPQLRADGAPSVRKVVVKIPAHLVA
ncbi:MAG: YhcH/YjgK/YiaL family protein [Verrucomicrobiales bacterium]|nr:YhcH/YjgK/YiaL family protein [Verrucomicrobiales bacterium]